MDRITFDDAIDKIFAYYDYREPEGRRREMIFDKVKEIPTGAVEYIVNGITDEKDTPPRNLAKAFNEYYIRWGQSPEHNKKQEERPLSCPDCGGEGFIHFRQADHLSGHMYKKIAICASCENWKRFGGGYNKISKDSPVFPMHFRADIEKRGMKVDIPLGLTQ